MSVMHKVVLSLVTALVLAGCAVGPNYVRPDTPMPGKFVGANDAAYQEQPAPAQFWTVFGDDTLTSLVADALAANHDLRIAAANLDAARALRRNAASDFFPVV